MNIYIYSYADIKDKNEIKDIEKKEREKEGLILETKINFLISLIKCKIVIFENLTNITGVIL